MSETLTLPSTPSFRLDGKRALVTGASRGIGLAAAAALAQAGASVVLAARSSGDINAGAAAITAAGGQATALQLDVTDQNAVSAAIAEHGPFHVLVNNAGTNRPALAEDVTEPDFDLVMDLNVKAAFFVARAVCADLRANGLGGSVINIGSQMGHVGGPKRSVYCASKHAMEGFTKVLAWEFGRDGVRVNTLCPTFIETPMTAPMLEDAAFMQLVTDKIALGRVGQVEDLMGAFVFLASDTSKLVTGSALMVDGGWTAI